MIEGLLKQPAHVRERLVHALKTALLVAPYEEAAVRSALGGDAAAPSIRHALNWLNDRGIPGPAVALALETASRAAADMPRPDLVWSGPEVPGLHARDTRRVYEELVASAERSLWISTYAYYDGPQAFKSLAARMQAVPHLQVTLLLNIQRRPGDLAATEQLVVRFAERLWHHDWPGPREPAVFYDPRSLEPHAPGGILHAKAVVADDEAAFVTSANLTEAAFDRNIEVGILTRDRPLAASLARHFGTLIDRGLLLPLPSRTIPLPNP
jgi:phosphatidylserine/phosphatidylglycerophosphate/cardiolipin synthase-like enzyme